MDRPFCPDAHPPGRTGPAGQPPCEPGRSRRDLLRARTSDIHAALDRRIETWLRSPAADYAIFLKAHRRALATVEAALDVADAGAVLPDWPRRRKLALLDSDLATLGAAPPPALAVSCGPSGSAECLGAIYVVEGATFGGVVLERMACERFGREVVGATRYLASYGGERGTMWRRFLAALEAHPAGWRAPDALVAGALWSFTQFVEALAGLSDCSESQTVPARRRLHEVR